MFLRSVWCPWKIPSKCILHMPNRAQNNTHSCTHTGYNTIDEPFSLNFEQKTKTAATSSTIDDVCSKAKCTRTHTNAGMRHMLMWVRVPQRWHKESAIIQFELQTNGARIGLACTQTPTPTPPTIAISTKCTEFAIGYGWRGALHSVHGPQICPCLTSIPFRPIPLSVLRSFRCCWRNSRHSIRGHVGPLSSAASCTFVGTKWRTSSCGSSARSNLITVFSVQSIMQPIGWADSIDLKKNELSIFSLPSRAPLAGIFIVAQSFL